VTVSQFFSILNSELKKGFMQTFEEQIDKFKYGDIVEKVEVIGFAVVWPIRCAWRILHFTIGCMVLNAVLSMVVVAVLYPAGLTWFFEQAALAHANNWVTLINEWFGLNFIAAICVVAFGGLRMPSTKPTLPHLSAYSGSASSVK